MKVKELIEKLQALGEECQDWDVEFICGNGWDWEPEIVEVNNSECPADRKVIIY